MSPRVRVAIVGAGWWSSYAHAPALLANVDAELAAVCDTNRNRLDAFADHFEVPARFTDHCTMLAEAKPDAVIVAAPHAMHAPIACDCLRHGAHVLVEKPLALEPAAAWEVVAVAAEYKRSVLVGVPYNLHPHASIVRSLLAQGTIGDLVLISGAFHSRVAEFYRGTGAAAYAQFRDFSIAAPLPTTYADVSQSGGGQAQTQLPHLLALLLYETATDAVVDDAAMYWERDGIDSAVALLGHTVGGAIVSVNSTGTLSFDDPCVGSLRFDGTHGYVVHDFLNGEITTSVPGLAQRLGLEAPSTTYPIDAPANALVAVARGETIDAVGGNLGASIVDLVSAAYVKARQHPRLDFLDTRNDT